MGLAHSVLHSASGDPADMTAGVTHPGLQMSILTPWPLGHAPLKSHSLVTVSVSPTHVPTSLSLAV